MNDVKPPVCNVMEIGKRELGRMNKRINHIKRSKNLAITALTDDQKTAYYDFLNLIKENDLTQFVTYEDVVQDLSRLENILTMELRRKDDQIPIKKCNCRSYDEEYDC